MSRRNQQYPLGQKMRFFRRPIDSTRYLPPNSLALSIAIRREKLPNIDQTSEPSIRTRPSFKTFFACHHPFIRNLAGIRICKFWKSQRRKLATVEEIRASLGCFSYFSEWGSDTIEECCRISKMKEVEKGRIVLGEGHGERSYVYFVVEGRCDVIEYSRSIGGSRRFVKVCTLDRLSCFNLGENLLNRQIVTSLRSKFLLIPFYWLVDHNVANIWGHTRQFLDWKVPKSDKLSLEIRHNGRWEKHKKKVAAKSLRRKIGQVALHDVPYALRI